MLITSIFAFSHNGSVPKANFKFLFTFLLSSTYAFNFDETKICSLDKDLTLCSAQDKDTDELYDTCIPMVTFTKEQNLESSVLIANADNISNMAQVVSL